MSRLLQALENVQCASEPCDQKPCGHAHSDAAVPQASNGNAPYELPKYLTEAEANAGAAALKDDEEDQEVETFGGDDL